jgi:biotin carboxyl carrier protein
MAAPVLAADIPYTAVIGGTVTSVVSVGTDVHEGDVLLTVNSLAGPYGGCPG